MEKKKEEKQNKTINILTGIIIGLVISLVGILIYKYVIPKGDTNNNGVDVPIQHGVVELIR